ncbi:MAG: RHS repeat-associated core domain-containing protein [Hyphomicrobium sp.]
MPYAYTYNNANRLKTVSVSSLLTGTYVYNGLEQLISRVVTNSGTANGTTYYVHDLWGNVIAELTTAGVTLREYIWLPETEIAPTRGARTQVERPLAVVDLLSPTPPTIVYATLYVHVDHLNRPMMMTDASKANVWAAEYTPWGSFQSATGAQTLNTRFPGQYYQLEAGLHYNWHRHYDPTIGRYTQPDPLGFVDGPSVYAYARSAPQIGADFMGLETAVITGGSVPGNPFGHTALTCTKCGVYSFGNNVELGSSVSKYVTSQSKRRSQYIQILPTTPEEEKCIRDYLDAQSPILPHWRTGDTCACRTLEALRRCTSFDLSGMGCMFPGSVSNIIKQSTTRTMTIEKDGPPPNLYNFNK